MRGTLALASFVLLAACSDDPASTTSGSSSGGSSSSSTSSSSSASSTGGGTGTDSDLCVSIVNEYRATKGLAAFENWSDGHACAAGQAKKDSETKKPHGSFPGCGEFAQNECPDYPGKDSAQALRLCLQMMWGEGPGGGHYDNMASTRYHDMACGLYTTPAGKIWAVQNFR